MDINILNNNMKKKDNKLKSLKKRAHIFTSWLLVKETLKKTWKSKLQLVILLLLSAFSTALITSTWISYTRIVEEAKTIGFDNHQFDAIMEYKYPYHKAEFSASSAVSVNYARIYSKKKSSALVYNRIILGQDTKPLHVKDFVIANFARKSDNKIEHLKLNWKDSENPLTANFDSINVKASLFGQLMAEYKRTKDQEYKKWADLLWKTFIEISAPKIIAAINTYIREWIEQNSTDNWLSLSQEQFLKNLLAHKINYQENENWFDNLIPNDLNVDEINDPKISKVFASALTTRDRNPRATGSDKIDKGINGDWIRVTRTFNDKQIENEEIRCELNNYISTTKYKSQDNDLNFNFISDIPVNVAAKEKAENNNNSKTIPTYQSSIYGNMIVKASAALQGYRADIVNQFTTTEAEPQPIKKVKIINIGTKAAFNYLKINIIEGRAPTSNNEVVITPQYARYMHIKPGDKIKLSENKDKQEKQYFLVTGIGGHSYHIYPTINDADVIPNTKNEFLVYVLPDAYSSGNLYDVLHRIDVSLVYFVPWKNKNANHFDKHKFNDYFQPNLFKNDKVDKGQSNYFQYLIDKYGKNVVDSSKLKSKIKTNKIVTKSDREYFIYSSGFRNFKNLKTGFLYLSCGSVLILLLVIIFITYLIVRKAIQKNQVSMGILKANGYLTWRVAQSYLAYPMIVTFIAIPIGWIVGLIAQYYFVEIFNSLFILPYNIFSINITPFFIAIAIITSFITVTTLTTAYQILQKNPLLLIKKGGDIEIGKTTTSWWEQKFEKSFHLRFLISLSKTSWKKILIIGSVIGVATLALTATISIPATISSMKNSYFAYQNYKNAYKYLAPVPNHPLNKIGYYNWTGIDNTNPQEDEYYPVSGIMPWMSHKIIMKDGEEIGYFDPLQVAQKNKNETNIKNVVTYLPGVSEETKQQFEAAANKKYNIPTLALETEDLLEMFSWLSTRGFSAKWMNDIKSKDKTENQKFTESLTALAEQLVAQILNVKTHPGKKEGNPIANLIKEFLPGYQRQILENSTTSDPYEKFVIGFNSVATDISHSDTIGGSVEELITTYDLYQKNGKMMNIVGISPETNMIKIDSKTRMDMKYVPNEEGIIPVLITVPFANDNKLSINSQFSGMPDVPTLCYKTRNGEYRPMPKANWRYEDTTKNANIWDVSPNHWKYGSEKDLVDGFRFKYGYNFDGQYNKKGEKIRSKTPTPWNDVEKILLELPNDITQEAYSGRLSASPDNKNDWPTLDFNINNIIVNNNSNIIRPFSYKIANKYHTSPPTPIEILQKKPPEWYGAMIDKGVLAIKNSIDKSDLNGSFENMKKVWYPAILNDNNPAKTYKVVGIIKSYDTSVAYVDKNAANHIVGYGTIKDGKYYEPKYPNEQSQYFNGKLSVKDTNDEIARGIFVYKSLSYTTYSLSLESTINTMIMQDQELLSRKQEMLNKIADITLSSSLLFIIITIICSILIVIMVTDLFTDQFRRFMALMKSEGYKNREINAFTLGIFTPWVIVGYFVGFGLGYLALFALLKIVALSTKYFLPFTFIWWILPLTFVIVTTIYISTFVINNYQLSKMNLIDILKADE